MSHSAIRLLSLSLAVIVWIGIPISQSVNPQSRFSNALCPSGVSEAKLTGWSLDGKIPVGVANYNEATKQLTVSVESIALANGTTLSVLIGDDRIGQLQPLKDGAASGTLTRTLPDGARVRIFSGDRPILSANLRCIDPTPTPTPTATPSPSPSPAPSPSGSPTPSPTASPTPTGEPTPDPMPRHSPAPSPSPTL